MQTLLAIVLGLAFGVVFERYYLCMNSAITDVFLIGDTGKVKGLLASLLVSAALFNLLIGLGVTKASPTPLWPTTLVAGVVFGIGMNLAGGCVSGTLFKMGQGHVASIVASLGVVLGLATTGAMMSFVPLPAGEMRSLLRGTLPGALGVDPLPFAMVVIAGCLVAWWAWGRHRKSARSGPAVSSTGNTAGLRGEWSGFVLGGVLVAILNTIFFVAFSAPVGLGGLMAYAASGLAYLADGAWALRNPMFGYMLHNPGYALIGVLFLAGATLSAMATGRFRLRLPVRRQSISSLIGGYLMGVSTHLMVGCNVTHILGGLPQFGVGSVVATVGIVIGAWVGAKLMTTIVTQGA